MSQFHNSFAFQFNFSDSIDCVTDICHLAWLIKYNQHLMKGISFGICSNGTAFEDLVLNDVNCSLASLSAIYQPNRFCPESEVIAPCKCVNYGFETNGMMALDCAKLTLNDEETSHILTTFIRNSSDFTLLRLVSFMLNGITKIPREIRLFPRLTQMNFAFNRISTIRADDFNFTSPIVSNDETVYIVVAINNINYIEPGAFDGMKSALFIILIWCFDVV